MSVAPPSASCGTTANVFGIARRPRGWRCECLESLHQQLRDAQQALRMREHQPLECRARQAGRARCRAARSTVALRGLPEISAISPTVSPAMIAPDQARCPSGDVRVGAEAAAERRSRARRASSPASNSVVPPWQREPLDLVDERVQQRHHPGPGTAGASRQPVGIALFGRQPRRDRRCRGSCADRAPAGCDRSRVIAYSQAASMEAWSPAGVASGRSRAPSGAAALRTQVATVN